MGSHAEKREEVRVGELMTFMRRPTTKVQPLEKIIIIKISQQKRDTERKSVTSAAAPPTILNTFSSRVGN